jgi:hypothetical protein
MRCEKIDLSSYLVFISLRKILFGQGVYTHTVMGPEITTPVFEKTLSATDRVSLYDGPITCVYLSTG